jgi:hypothetical protein
MAPYLLFTLALVFLIKFILKRSYIVLTFLKFPNSYRKKYKELEKCHGLFKQKRAQIITCILLYLAGYHKASDYNKMYFLN